ncbi:MAG: histidine phosphatase family protein [Oscillospiraceae bacterium]|nr:histidine phosphatase family protein [Oscillospiraceae bacterium]
MQTQIEMHIKTHTRTRTLYLVRHGEPEFEGGEPRCVGRTDLSLSERGKRQASDLTKFFSDKNITTVYHSYLLRAKQTAELISNGERSVVQEEGLEELDAGEWENLTFGEIRSLFPELYERRGWDIASNPPPGGEEFTVGLLRFKSAIKRILNIADCVDEANGADMSGITDMTSGNIVVVAHAGVNKLFLCDALDLDYNSVLNLAQPYGCINAFEITDGGLRVEYYGVLPVGTPDEAECNRILEHYKTPGKVVAHCRAVSRKAVEIAELLSQRADCCIDLELIKSAALLHDVARVEQYHDEAGYTYLLKCGYPRVANIIRSHHGLAPGDLKSITESTIVFYADKLISGVKEVTIEERFRRSRGRCLTPEAIKSHDQQYNQALIARDLINQFSERSGEL